jgi:hypothetical protein
MELPIKYCQPLSLFLLPLTFLEIPLGTRVVDECTQCLFGGNEDQDTQLFGQAMIEATDFLMAEVYPSFEKLPLEQFERKQSIDVRFLNFHRFLTTLRLLIS